MKLFAWQPDGHGQLSFFVMAEDEEAAKKAVEAEIQKLLKASEEDEYYYPNFDLYEYDGWGTDYYKLTVAEVGQVIINNND